MKMPMKRYQLNIGLAPGTLAQLRSSGFQLYGFLAAQVSDARSRPLLWYATGKLGLNNLIGWFGQYQVYTSNSPFQLAPQEVVELNAITFMNPGQLLTVNARGTGPVTNQGTAGRYSIFNNSTTPQVCGLLAEGKAFCALPLDGNLEQQFKALPKLLVLFAPDLYPFGTVLQHWLGTCTSGLLADLSSIGSANVRFDMDTGLWDWSKQTWGHQIQPGADLAALLLSDF